MAKTTTPRWTKHYLAYYRVGLHHDESARPLNCNKLRRYRGQVTALKVQPLLAVLPPLSLTAIALEIGVTRERVRQIANKLEGVTHRGYRAFHSTVCTLCGNPFKRSHSGYRNTRCPACLANWHKHLRTMRVCEACGNSFPILTSKLQRNKALTCSRSCRSRAIWQRWRVRKAKGY